MAETLDPPTSSDRDPTCPICGDTKTSPLGSCDGRSVRVCDPCGLHFTHPLPDADELQELYEGYTTNEAAIEGFDGYVRASKRFLRRRLEFVDQIRGASPESLLDVGSGPGHQVAAADELGLQAAGIEIDEAALSFAHERGVPNMHRGPLPVDAIEGERFHVVQLFHVLEHVTDPISVLEHATEHLSADGVLAVDVPNQSSLAARTKRLLRPTGLVSSDIGYVQPPEHPLAFTPSALRRSLEEAGLEVVKVETGNPLDDTFFPTGDTYLDSPRGRATKAFYTLFGRDGYLAAFATPA